MRDGTSAVVARKAGNMGVVNRSAGRLHHCRASRDISPFGMRVVHTQEAWLDGIVDHIPGT